MTTTKLYVTGRQPASVPLIQRFQIQVAENDHTMELQRIWHVGMAMTQTIRLLNFTDGHAAKSDTPDTKIRSNEQRGVFNLTQVTEDVSLQGSCILPSRKLSILHGPVWPTKKLRTVRHDPHKNCSGQSLVPTSKWCDTAETVSTMIRQTFETNISSNLHKFNPSLRFLPCRT